MSAGTRTANGSTWTRSRDYRPGDAAIDDRLREASSQAYYKDVEVPRWASTRP